MVGGKQGNGHLVSLTMDHVDAELESINRKFVHRINNTGYENFADLLADMRSVQLKLPIDAPASEYWLRITNEVADYIRDWQRNIDWDKTLAYLKTLEHDLCLLVKYLTATQITRLNSIILRTRQTVVQLDPDEEAAFIYENLLQFTGSSLNM